MLPYSRPSSSRAPYPSLLRQRAGFTIIEATVAVAITAMAGIAILTGVSAALQNTQYTLEQTVGLGLAQQLMDEIAGKPYATNPSNPFDAPLGPTASDVAGSGRSKFGNIGSYNGFVDYPPTDATGILLGTGNGQGGQRDPNLQNATYFQNWQRSVVVYYVSPSDMSTAMPGGQTSNHRAVEVQISIHDASGAVRPVFTLRRVFSYVPNS
ncbi:MAG TPA: hypothetical protein VGH32_08310 [Pirellulales bacterium]